MTLTLGVAIPCYSGHFQYLNSLLANIASSTVKPTAICISCSSWTHNKKEYFEFSGIPVIIWYSSEKLNVSQNRNRAASLLKTNLISFLDADDLMHPKRVEFLIGVFETRPDISAVFHDYMYHPISMRDDPFWDEPQANPLPNKVRKDPNATGIIVEGGPYAIHQAQVTIRSRLFSIFRFNESWEHFRREDSMYAATLVLHEVPCLYLNNKLSRYIFNN
jgi:glycosyltransferase involved in cell wall biosynthesis